MVKEDDPLPSSDQALAKETLGLLCCSVGWFHFSEQETFLVTYQNMRVTEVIGETSLENWFRNKSFVMHAGA